MSKAGDKDESANGVNVVRKPINLDHIRIDDEEEDEMGLIASLFRRDHGRTDDPDPITGLTSRDKYLVKTTWEPLKKDSVKNGVGLLILLFETFPKEQDYFPFRGTPLKELSESIKFHAHCNSVMYAVSSVVDALDNSELLVQILLRVAATHKRHNVPPQSFWNLKIVMLDLFKKLMSKEAVDAWDKALEVSFKVLEKEL